MLLTVSVVRDVQGRALHIIEQVQDISERKERARQLEYLVDHDFLTGLYNRRWFERELAREVERASRYGTPCAVLVIDLDHFKEINDSLGHRAGDDLLKGVAGLLKERARQADVLARLGGDEFALLLPQTTAAHAEMKNFPFDYIKIDGGFIRGLVSNPMDQLVVKAIVTITQGLGKKTVAEFVAEPETAALLRAIGVDCAQGYYIGEPRPILETLGAA